MLDTCIYASRKDGNSQADDLVGKCIAQTTGVQQIFGALYLTVV